MSQTKLLDQFSNDFAQLLESEYDYNVVIKINNQFFKLHSLVLYQRSSFFRQELSATTKKNNLIEITVPHISAESFKILIKYIYTGKTPLENVEPSTIFDLLISSNKLSLEELVDYIQSYLIDNNASWLKLKFTQVYYTSFQNNRFKALQTFCTDILAKHPKLIFDSNDFTSVQENALVALLKRDDLQLEESEIWDKPYRQILESSLWHDITTRTMAPDISISSTILPARKIIPVQLPVREDNFSNPSSIINEEHFAEISSWINRNSSTSDITSMHYKFKLLLRGSRDGFGCESFLWPSDSKPKWLKTSDSFIFSLKTQNLPESILSRIIHPSEVIQCDDEGPAFGSYFYLYDEKVWSYRHHNLYYEKLLRDTIKNVFLVDEIEVFQVLKS
ncbi:hypothetical protein C2G38_2189582 [Gigaspora rosea]|uniref:BTB domain-containing protein n=1 Tax=Gigaspora rosea TaxID=44941 RepID=A0A397V4L4_9GLOM|nr:hypothetical protein C2G38_2189582 [Gigaspora rosea]